MVYVYAAAAQYVLLTIFSTNSKFHPVSNFTEFALNLVTHSFVFRIIQSINLLLYGKQYLINSSINLVNGQNLSCTVGDFA